jgi:AraC-like DNA-binding protein
MTFGQWRQQMRLAHAAPPIAHGLPLSDIAAEPGYAGQSAFSAMFKKIFGKSHPLFWRKKPTNSIGGVADNLFAPCFEQYLLHYFQAC